MRLTTRLPTRPTTVAGSLVLAAAGALLPLVPVAPLASAQQATPTCHGLAATIVGTGRVNGTDGADVIVTHGHVVVDAGGGDDTVCVGTLGHDEGVPSVRSGDGDDYVQNRSARQALVQLGRGDDRFVGGPAREDVADGDAAAADPGFDTIATGGGDDHVRTGSPGVPNRDQVDTGAGDDLRGGPGDDVARGGHGDDVIAGNPGRDAAYGGPGTDRCGAEVRESCERR